MKALLLALLVASPAHASWHYNEDGGFGIYQPEGWEVQHEGRSSRLTGPESDVAQSEIFLGSDWTSRVRSPEDLERYAREESGSRKVEPITVSDLPGYRYGTPEHGGYFLLRLPENVIVVRYELRGSPSQIEEGSTMIGSIEVRTKPNPEP